MSTWFWLNVPPCVAIFSAVAGIPLWLTFKRPDTGREVAEVRARLTAVPMHAVSRDEVAAWRAAA